MSNMNAILLLLCCNCGVEFLTQCVDEATTPPGPGKPINASFCHPHMPLFSYTTKVAKISIFENFPNLYGFFWYAIVPLQPTAMLTTEQINLVYLIDEEKGVPYGTV